jgi:hypothetical protein
MRKPKILVFDIETAPITAYTWGLFKQDIGLNQIKEDWHMLSWGAKWYGDPASKVMYMDNSGAKDIRNDKRLVKGLARLLNQADIVITQNGKAFDTKKFNARAVLNGLPPVKPYQHTDILKESRKVFSFTSHKLAYMTEKLNKKYKKLDHKEYPGFELWSAILKGDQHAWAVMKKYCIHDVLATEETYDVIQGWIKTQNMASYIDGVKMLCKCGSDNLVKKGFARTDAGKFQIFLCRNCGKWPRSPKNLFNKKKKQSLLRDWR